MSCKYRPVVNEKSSQKSRSIKEKDEAAEGNEDSEALQRILDAFLDHLVAARNARGLRQQELAKLAGLRPGHMSNIELGKRGITLGTFIRIAKGLGLRPAELAVYLGSLPGTDATRGPATVVPVVSVATDGTVSRDSLQEALGELSSGEARSDQRKRQRHNPRAKAVRSKKSG